jgi:hypothetical protein
MAWKHLVTTLAVAPRWRVVAAVLVYGLALAALGFASAAGKETQVPPPAAGGIHPMTSTMIKPAPLTSRCRAS